MSKLPDKPVEIGTVEFMRLRILPLDGEIGRTAGSNEVMVAQGTVSPVYQIYETFFYMAEGVLNLGGLAGTSKKLWGDESGGTFSLNTHNQDIPSQIRVVVPTARMSMIDFKMVIEQNDGGMKFNLKEGWDNET